MNWTHSISVGAAEWIYSNDITDISLSLNEGFIELRDNSGKVLKLPFIVFYKNEIVLKPSVHSICCLSSEVANSLYNWKQSHGY